MCIKSCLQRLGAVLFSLYSLSPSGVGAHPLFSMDGVHIRFFDADGHLSRTLECGYWNQEKEGPMTFEHQVSLRQQADAKWSWTLHTERLSCDPQAHSCHSALPVQSDIHLGHERINIHADRADFFLAERKGIYYQHVVGKSPTYQLQAAELIIEQHPLKGFYTIQALGKGPEPAELRRYVDHTTEYVEGRAQKIVYDSAAAAAFKLEDQAMLRYQHHEIKSPCLSYNPLTQWIHSCPLSSASSSSPETALHYVPAS